MKALLIKDFCLIKNQKTVLPVFFILAILYSAFYNAAFGISFLGMIAATTGIGTVSYDDFDHGNRFLFTLPFDRKSYVNEKFLFCFLLSVIGAGFASLLALLLSCFREDELPPREILLFFAASLLLSLLIAGCMLPLRIRFGTERGKLVGFVIVGVLFSTVSIVASRIPDGEMNRLLTDIGVVKLGIIALSAVLLLTGLGYALSLRWLNRMEF